MKKILFLVFVVLLILVVPRNVKAEVPPIVPDDPNVKLINSLEELKEVFKTGGEIKLNTDIEVGSFTGVMFEVMKDVILSLDLNGHVISGKNSDETISTSLISNKGLLIIKDSGTKSGKITLGDTEVKLNTYSRAVVTINNMGVLVISGGIIENTGRTDVPYVIDNNSTSENVLLTINDGIITSNSAAIRLFANSTVKNNEVIINGGEIRGSTGIWIQQPNVKANKANLTINNGIIYGSKSSGIYATINNSDASNAVSVKVNGGVIMNNALNSATLAFRPVSGTSLKNAILNLSITGGTLYNANISGPSLMEWNYYTDINPNNMVIVGGVFSSDPKDVVPTAKGYVVEKTSPVSSDFVFLENDDDDTNNNVLKIILSIIGTIVVLFLGITFKRKYVVN